MTRIDQGQGVRRGASVIAYPGPHEIRGVVVSDKLAFGAFDVRTEPIYVKPTDKRRRRVTITVAESKLKVSDDA